MENRNSNDHWEYESYWTCNTSISSGSPVERQGISSPSRDPRISCNDYGNNPYHFSGIENGPPRHCFPLGYENGYNFYETQVTPTSVVRVVKRRNTANKKERRRTQSINNAFADLRDCIPNVPADTKLSKIKTLRLATSYIGYLMGVLASDDPDAVRTEFRADLANQSRRSSKKESEDSSFLGDERAEKKGKGRTGWPQHVWALELKQEGGLVSSCD